MRRIYNRVDAKVRRIYQLVLREVLSLKTMRKDIDDLIYLAGLAWVECDKCNEFNEEFCFKCEGTGTIRRNQLCSWTWL